MGFKKSKIIWEAISHFIVGLGVVDLAILILVVTPASVFEIRWLTILGVAVMGLIPFAMSFRAVMRERNRQEAIGLNRVPSVLHYPFLGELRRWEDDPIMWHCVVKVGISEVSIVIAGEGFPNEELLARAAAFAQSLESFVMSLPMAFKKVQDSDPWLAQFADEIAQLKVREVFFSEPTDPESTEVYFDGVGEARCWAGNIQNQQLVALGCET